MLVCVCGVVPVCTCLTLHVSVLDKKAIMQDDLDALVNESSWGLQEGGEHTHLHCLGAQGGPTHHMPLLLAHVHMLSGPCC